MPFLLKVVVKNLGSERLAWALNACGVNKERKLLAGGKNLLVQDDWTGVFPSAAYYVIFFIKKSQVTQKTYYWSTSPVKMMIEGTLS